MKIIKIIIVTITITKMLVMLILIMTVIIVTIIIVITTILTIMTMKILIMTNSYIAIKRNDTDNGDKDSPVQRVTSLCVIFRRHCEMRENNYAHSTATSVHCNKLTLTKHLRGEKTV